MGIQIRKSRQPVFNIFSALNNLKETNLTACLGYLIASFPAYFSQYLLRNKTANISSVDIENFNRDKDRFDIVLNCGDELVVIEAKIGFSQIEEQIKKYIKHLYKRKFRRIRLIILDRGSFRAQVWCKDLQKKCSKKCSIEFITWQEIYEHLKNLLKYKRLCDLDARAYYVANEFMIYLEEEAMVQITRKEVYTRDVSGRSIELFFKHRIYKCQPKFFKSAFGNAYFAPYFTGRAPKDFSESSIIRIEEGISWISPILETEVIKQGEVKNYLKAKGHPEYAQAAKNALQIHDEKEMAILLLGDPFLAFHTPISKKKLGLTGAMGSRSVTFQQLFEAARKAS